MHRRRNNYKPKSAPAAVDTAATAVVVAIADTPVVAAFRQYARELDAKHDRYERIIKRSRDITIESKRIIFLLHTVNQSQAPDATTAAAGILGEAGKRLRTLAATSFAAIALELRGLDAHQFMRAFSAGLQEFIEALTFWQYLSGERLFDWHKVTEMLTTSVPRKKAAADPEATEEEDDTATETKAKEEEQAPALAVVETAICPVDAMEYMQGLGDLGGEVMRQCIGALGGGDFETCFRGCAFLRAMNTGYNGLMFNHRNRHLTTKVTTLRQSLLKVEHVCYNIRVRGKEAGTLSLLNGADAGAAGEDDEGFSNF